MKIKTLSATRLALLCTALVGAWLMLSGTASAVSIGDARASIYLSQLTSMALPSNEMNNEQSFRSVGPTRLIVLDWSTGGRSIEVINGPRPGGGPEGVPDGGITATLLGVALGALGIARRYTRT